MLADIRNTIPRSATSLPPLNVVEAWRGITGPVEPFLIRVQRGLSSQVEEFHPAIREYAHYALSNQGKQIRPTLLALSGAVFGPASDALVDVAVMIEMVHLATLVHDDVMDEAEVRRSRPTLAANWGNQRSVLVGDCLFAQALRLASNFSTAEVCRAVATATKAVCTGEIIQTHQRHNFNISLEEYLQALSMKTGELFALSCEMGAFLSGASPSERASLRAFGMTLGTAYQIYDDCLDLFGTESVVGKSLGTDLASGKPTFPILEALKSLNRADRERLIKRLENWNGEFFEETIELLHRSGVLTNARRLIRDHLDRGVTCLEGLPRNSEAANALRGVCEFLADQTAALGFESVWKDKLYG